MTKTVFALIVGSLTLQASFSQNHVLDGFGPEYVMIRAYEKAVSDWRTMQTKFSFSINIKTEELDKKDKVQKVKSREYLSGVELDDDEHIVRVQDVIQPGRHVYERDYASETDNALYAISFAPLAKKFVAPLADAHLGSHAKNVNEVLSNLTGKIVVRRSDFSVVSITGAITSEIAWSAGLNKLKDARFEISQKQIGEMDGIKIFAPTESKFQINLKLAWFFSRIETTTIKFSVIPRTPK